MISKVRICVNPVDIPIKLARRLGYAKAFSFLTPGDAKTAAWMQDAGLVETVCESGTVRYVRSAAIQAVCCNLFEVFTGRRANDESFSVVFSNATGSFAG